MTVADDAVRERPGTAPMSHAQIQVREGRNERLRRHLDSWPEEDVRTLATLLARFNAIAAE